MSRCISRRACSDRNSFKLINDKGENGKYIWTEFRCPNVVSSSNHCIECIQKLPKHKYQSSPKCDHGNIGGPYPSDSKLYGSPYYLSQIKSGWKISEEDELRAKDAISKAISEMPITPTSPAKPLVIKTEIPKKPRKQKVSKKATDIILQTPEKTPIPELKDPKYIEEMTTPLQVTEVIVVKVKKIKCDGKEYYLDTQSGKAYAALANGVGPYKGRYNSESETLNTNTPDSDLE